MNLCNLRRLFPLKYSTTRNRLRFYFRKVLVAITCFTFVVQTIVHLCASFLCLFRSHACEPVYAKIFNKNDTFADSYLGGTFYSRVRMVELLLRV